MNDYMDEMSARNRGARKSVNGARAAVAGIGAGLLWHLVRNSGNRSHRQGHQRHR